MSQRFYMSLLFFCAICFSLTHVGELDATEIDAKLSEDGKKVTVTVDGKLFAEYLTFSGAKPIVWPIIGPTGKRMTREYPIAPLGKHELNNCPHHRSMWFTYGELNGINFWAEAEFQGAIKIAHGEIRHREFVKIASGETAQIITRNDWRKLDDGTRVCEDETKITFGADENSRWIDHEIIIKASDGPLNFVDTKEGGFGVRVAPQLRPYENMGGVLINSEGQKNEQAWGKKARWVDYSGKLGDDVVGITMMNHPSSFRYPTHWHARDYGLCAANPFGWSYFEGEGHDGSYTVPAGGSIRFCHRVLFHKGDSKEAKVEEAFEAYKKTAK